MMEVDSAAGIESVVKGRYCISTAGLALAITAGRITKRSVKTRSHAIVFHQGNVPLRRCLEAIREGIIVVVRPRLVSSLSSTVKFELHSTGLVREQSP
jgi:hypothetical protein